MSLVAPRQTHERIFSPLRQRKIVLFTSNGNIIGYNKSSTEMIGTASFFTEDIDEFEHNYFSDENVESNQLEAQKQRYFRSKTGEIVTDY